MRESLYNSQKPRTAKFAANARHETNVLLIKDDVGRPKPYTRRLPNGYFSYGDPVVFDDEGAGEGRYMKGFNFFSNERLAVPV